MIILGLFALRVSDRRSGDSDRLPYVSGIGGSHSVGKSFREDLTSI